MRWEDLNTSSTTRKQSYLNTKWVEFRAVLISSRPQATTAHSPWVYNQHVEFTNTSDCGDRQRAFLPPPPPDSSDIWTHSSRKRKYSFLVSKTSTSWRILGCFTLRRCDTEQKAGRGAQRERENDVRSYMGDDVCIAHSVGEIMQKICFDAHE